jgi:hypothetical protein
MGKIICSVNRIDNPPDIFAAARCLFENSTILPFLGNEAMVRIVLFYSIDN